MNYTEQTYLDKTVFYNIHKNITPDIDIVTAPSGTTSLLSVVNTSYYH